MPRPVYHQSPGNPIQVRRLPEEPPELELARHRGVDSDDARFTKRIFHDLFFASVIGLGVAWVSGFLALWYAFFLPLLFFLVFNLGNYLAGVQCQQRSVQIVLFAGACVFHEFELPLPVVVAIAIVCTSLLAREIARHFCFIATVDPLDRQLAWEIRDQCLKQTFVTSLLLFPVGLGICVPGLLVTASIVSLSGWLAACVWWKVDLDRVPEGVTDALCSWCSYNRVESVAPGILQSPAGPARRRWKCLLIVVLLAALLLGRLTLEATILPVSALLAAVVDGTATLPMTFRLILLLTSGLFCLGLPVVGVVVGIAFVGTPVFAGYRLPVPGVVPPKEWQQITARLRQSNNKVERDSLYIGRLLHDQSPLLVPSLVFSEHAHFLGDSGSGKTARGLAPLIQQLLGRGDCSVMVIDMKGDSQELFETLRQGARDAARHIGRPVPVRYFTTRENDATFAFNPFALSGWQQLNVFQKTDILCGAMGLMYGSEYGEGYYSSANAAVIHAAVSHFPEIGSFAELQERLSYVIARPKAHGLDAESSKAGNHVKMTVTRLQSFAGLNVTANQAPAPDVVDQAIDPSRMFRQPEAHYFHLSSMLGPASSPEIARLAIFMLLTCATLTKRSLPVFLVIDEFQRVASSNLDYLLQLARSVNVGVILANQSMEDLRKPGLIPVLETNCRYRQWFAVSGWDDQERLGKASGETVDQLGSVSVSHANTANGPRTSVNDSQQEFIGPRLTQNDIKFVSDDDRRSIVLVTRGAGYCQYGGLPIVIESDYHITKEEFERRRDAEWPAGEPGTFVPASWSNEPQTAPRKGRGRKAKQLLLTEETIEPVGQTEAGPFDRFLTNHAVEIEEVRS